MARPATPDQQINVALTPMAQPLGLYDRPAMPSPSPLHGVAEALSSLSGDLASWGKHNDAEQKKEDVLRAQADFYSSNGEGLAAGVASGEIPANKSPAYIQATKQLIGDSAGYKMDSAVSASFDNWDGKNTDDPAGFESWFSKNMRDQVKTNDPYIMKGLAPHIQAMHSRYHDKWQKQVTQNTVYMGQAGVAASASSAIDDAVQDSLADIGDGSGPAGFDVGLVGDKLDAIKQKGIAVGMTKEQVDETLITAITGSALRNRDPSILGLLDRDSNAGPSLGRTPTGLAAKDAAVKSLDALWHKESTEALARQAKEDKAAVTVAKSSIVDSIIKNPDAPIDPNLVNTVIQKGNDGSFKMDMMKWQDTMRSGQASDDPRKVNQLFTDILAGGDGQAKLEGAIRSGDIKSKESVVAAQAFIASTDAYKKSGSGILKTAAATSYEGQITKLGTDAALSEGRIMGDAPVLTEFGRQALNNYRRGLMEHAIQNPKESVMDTEDFSTKLGESILRNFKSENPADGKLYAPPAGTPAGPAAPSATTLQGLAPKAKEILQTMTGQPTPQAPAPSTPQAPTAAAPAAPSTPSPYSPEDMAKITTKAKELGVQPEVLIQRLQGMGIKGSATSGPRSEALPFAPGLGAVNISSNDAVAAIKNATRSMGLGGDPQTASLDGPATAQRNEPMINSRHVEAIRNSAVGPIIQRVAQRLGFDPEKAMNIAYIESTGDPNSNRDKSTMYKGLYQLNPQEWRDHGNGGNIYDPESNAAAGITSMMQKSARFSKEFGREPSATELYLMHQQGEAGLRAHERNPGAPAWQNMASTGEGKAKGDGWARKAIWGNIPDTLKRRFGSVENVSSREFMAVWTSKLLGVPFDQALAMNTGKAKPQQQQDEG